MTTLGLETAEAIGGAALWGDSGLLMEQLLDAPLQHAEQLVPAVNGLLASCSVGRQDIERIAVNQGPGSFTGLRIGLSTAKGLCQALQVPLVGVEATVAYRARADEGARVCVILQDRRDRYYVQRFSGDKPLAAVRVWSRQELVDRLLTVRSREVVIGSGVASLRDALEEIAIRSGGLVEIGSEALTCPSPATIARLGHEAPAGDALFDLEPTYVEPVLARSR